jgi:cold-inducible RNA-binding protein
MSKRLYVGNLSWEVAEGDLEKAFEQWGGRNAAIPTDRDSGRSKGFGFIEVEDDQMNSAISAMNGKNLSGRPLTVNEARPREDRGGGGGYGGGGGGRGGYGGGGGGYGGGRGGGGGRW